MMNFVQRVLSRAFSLRGLLLKSAALGLIWFFLPFWLFFVFAVYFYFVPPFQPFKIFFPFLLTIAFSFFLQQNLLSVFLVGVLFFLVLGIKNLILVHRFQSHQLMAFLLLFLGYFYFFSVFGNWGRPISSFALFAVGFSFFFLFYELSAYTSEKKREKKIAISAIGAFLVFQAAAAILFLPMNRFYQTAVLFLSSVIIADIFLEYLNNGLSRKKILQDFSVFFVVATLLLAAANWEL